MVPNSAAEAVAQGAQLLDEKYPGWWKIIDLKKLDLGSCEQCVCGQIGIRMLGFIGEDAHASYYQIRENLGLAHGMDHGFTAPSIGDWWYDDLDREWAKVIKTRLAADEVVAVEEKEMVFA